MYVFIKKRLIHGKNLYANYKQKHTVKLLNSHIGITKTKHLSSTKAYN